MPEQQHDKRAGFGSRSSPFFRLWHWLAGTSVVAAATPGAMAKARQRRRASPSSRTRFPVSPTQLAALTVALNTEGARPHLPNLLVVEQTLLCVSGGNDLAAVPDFVLARSRWELRSLAAFQRSKLLQAFDEAVGRQVRRNEQAQQALVWGQGALGVSMATGTSPGDGSGGDFEDTQPMGEGEGDGDFDGAGLGVAGMRGRLSMS
jgi:hypothetical protein